MIENSLFDNDWELIPWLSNAADVGVLTISAPRALSTDTWKDRGHKPLNNAPFQTSRRAQKRHMI